MCFLRAHQRPHEPFPGSWRGQGALGTEMLGTMPKGTMPPSTAFLPSGE